MTQSYDKSPHIHKKIQKTTWQHKNATKTFNNTKIADRLMTVSLSNNSDLTGMVKPVYERSAFQLTAVGISVYIIRFQKFTRALNFIFIG